MSSPFQSTPSTRRETVRHVLVCAAGCDFNPLPPHGGRRSSACPVTGTALYFNPLPPHGGRRRRGSDRRISGYFNPLPPHGGRPSKRCPEAPPAGYFNPLPPHGGRLLIDFTKSESKNISIHSLRMEGDVGGCIAGKGV